MHTVLLKDMAEAMKNEMVLASYMDSKTNSSKSLVFRPWDSKYVARYKDIDEDITEEFFSLIQAVGRYNFFNA